jgi:hypothetical protein
MKNPPRPENDLPLFLRRECFALQKDRGKIYVAYYVAYYVAHKVGVQIRKIKSVEEIGILGKSILIKSFF